MAEPERRRRRLRGSSTPAVGQPADDPGTSGPESTGPGTAGPESTGPGTAGPESTGPGAAGPESTGPGTAGPESTGPGTAGPESTGPGTAGPERPARRVMPGPFPRPSSPGDSPGSPAGEERAAPRAPERGMESLRGLVGSGSSQVSVGAAMRARDAARPTDEQLADAEQNLAVVRRNWTPREELPRGR